MENLNYENEIWKDIPEFNGFYQASNMGRIRSVDREKYVESNNQYSYYSSIRNLKGAVRKPSIDKYGYYFVSLNKNGKKKKCLIHRLVFEAFNGSISEGLQVNHINEIKTDNRLSNLNLMTAKENVNWGTRNEKCSKKLKNRKDQSKIVIQLNNNDGVIKEWNSLSEIQRELGYNKSNILKACNGKYKQAYGFKWQYK